MKKIRQIWLLALLVVAASVSGCSAEEEILGSLSGQSAISQEATAEQDAGGEENADDDDDAGDTKNDDTGAPEKDGTYTSKEDVAAYLRAYHELPSNFITKKEARSLGWEGGSLEDVAPGKCIGGDYFGNYEGLLPDDEYHECDIDTLGKRSRGAKRLVFSDDTIYYTEDHYRSFDEVE